MFYEKDIGYFNYFSIELKNYLCYNIQKGAFMRDFGELLQNVILKKKKNTPRLPSITIR